MTTIIYSGGGRRGARKYQNDMVVLEGGDTGTIQKEHEKALWNNGNVL